MRKGERNTTRTLGSLNSGLWTRTPNSDKKVKLELRSTGNHTWDPLHCPSNDNGGPQVLSSFNMARLLLVPGLQPPLLFNMSRHSCPPVGPPCFRILQTTPNKVRSHYAPLTLPLKCQSYFPQHRFFLSRHRLESAPDTATAASCGWGPCCLLQTLGMSLPLMVAPLLSASVFISVLGQFFVHEAPPPLLPLHELVCHSLV